jgi:hypothetical protein
MRSAIVRSAAQAAAFSVALACDNGRTRRPPPPPSVADDMPMADYLGLLAQIAPAAEEGARPTCRPTSNAAAGSWPRPTFGGRCPTATAIRC